jgi:hypothetical protein
MKAGRRGQGNQGRGCVTMAVDVGIDVSMGTGNNVNMGMDVPHRCCCWGPRRGSRSTQVRFPEMSGMVDLADGNGDGVVSMGMRWCHRRGQQRQGLPLLVGDGTWCGVLWEQGQKWAAS